MKTFQRIKKQLEHEESLKVVAVELLETMTSKKEIAFMKNLISQHDKTINTLKWVLKD